MFLAGGAAAVLLVVIIVASTRGCGDDAAPGGGGEGGGDEMASLADLEEGWREAGLEPGGFAPIGGQALGNGRCETGAVNGLDVTVCSYPDEIGRASCRGR